MSTTYHVYCDNCKTYYWCGQSHAREGSGYLYAHDNLMFKFLHEHIGHQLGFTMAEFTPDGYTDWEKK